MTKLWGMICKFVLILPMPGELFTTLGQHHRLRHRRIHKPSCHSAMVWICHFTIRGKREEVVRPRGTACPFALLMCFLRWKRGQETALAAALRCLQGDCSLTLQTGTMWYYNNKDSKSAWNAALFPWWSETTTMMPTVWTDCQSHKTLEFTANEPECVTLMQIKLKVPFHDFVFIHTVNGLRVRVM